jgi:glycosyltransferase involved in cell wall biosynthesis
VKRILFLTPYPFDKAPSQRLKFEQYYNAFEEEGFELVKNSFMSDYLWDIVYKKGNILFKLWHTITAYFRRWSTLFYVHQFDIVYVHLWGTPFGFPIYEWFLRKLSKKLIYDIDDMVFLGNSSAANSFISKIKGAGKMHFLMKYADHVITCTPALDNYVKKFTVKTTDISSTVNTDTRYIFNKKRYAPKEKIIIGWSGSHSTAKYLYLLENVLKKLSKEFQFKLLVMGDSTFHIDGVEIEAMEWQESYEMEVLNHFDIGLYPIPDEPWVYGKSGLKAIQYQALGIPVGASELGANKRGVKDKETGFLVQWDSEQEWYDAIRKLIINVELRKRLGLNARKFIVENYSVAVTKDKYFEVISGVLNN